MYKETVIKDTFLISTVNITATKTGILLCSASNNFGNSSDESIFLLTGKIFVAIIIIIIIIYDLQWGGILLWLCVQKWNFSFQACH